MDITGRKPGHLSGLTVCARNTFDAPQGRGERCNTRARLGLSFRRTLMIGRGMSGIKGLVSSRISNSLTTHGTWLSRPGLGQDEAPRSMTASWAINPSQDFKDILCFLLYYSLSRLSCIIFILVGWSFKCFNQYHLLYTHTFLSVKYPVYSRRALRICLLSLLWAWGCASIVNHGLVPGTRCNGYIA